MHFGRTRKNSRSAASSSSPASAASCDIAINSVAPAMEKENSSATSLNIEKKSSALSSSSSSSSSTSAPSLLRCHSDTSQRNICSNVNPNIISNSANIHRHGALSNSQKISTLQVLNSKLVNEVASLRSSIEALHIQLQTSAYVADSLRGDNKELEEKIQSLRSEMNEKAALFLSSEYRLQALVDELQNTNTSLAEEASRLKADAETFAAEKQGLMGKVESLLREKADIEDLLRNFRVGGENLKEGLKQAIAMADQQRKSDEAERENLEKIKAMMVEEKIELERKLCESQARADAMEVQNVELESRNKSLCDTVAKISADKSVAEKKAEELKLENKKVLAEKESFQNALLQAEMVSAEYECLRDISMKETSSLKKELSSALEINEELRSKSVSLHMEVSIASGVSTHLQGEIERLNQELERSKEVSAELTIQKNGFENRMRKLETELEAAIADKESLLLRNEETERRRSATKEEFLRTEKELSEKIHKLEEDLKEASKTEALVKEELCKKETLLREANELICALRGELLIAEEEGQKTKKERKAAADHLEQKISALESEVASMRKNRADMEALIVANEEALKKACMAREKIASAQDDLSACLYTEERKASSAMLMRGGISISVLNRNAKMKKNKKKSSSKSKAGAVQVKIPITVT